MRYFREKRKKQISDRFMPSKSQLPEVVGVGSFFLGNQSYQQLPAMKPKMGIFFLQVTFLPNIPGLKVVIRDLYLKIRAYKMDTI